ncbi:hypothetical protein FHT08_002236 [Xanthomonas campestris]|nr:hypothetical protein [Xanthomonas sp. CFBP 8151]
MEQTQTDEDCSKAETCAWGGLDKAYGVQVVRVARYAAGVYVAACVPEGPAARARRCAQPPCRPPLLDTCGFVEA